MIVDLRNLISTKKKKIRSVYLFPSFQAHWFFFLLVLLQFDTMNLGIFLRGEEPKNAAIVDSIVCELFVGQTLPDKS